MPRTPALLRTFALVLATLVASAPAVAAGNKRSAAKRAHLEPRRVARPGAEGPRSGTQAEHETARENAAPAAKAGPPAAAEQDAPREASLRKVAPSRHIEVHARDMRLDDVARERLTRIAARYFQSTRRKLVLTGGTRTKERQAELMFEKLSHGEDIVALYENKPAATEVQNVYREGVAKGLHKKALIKAIADQIAVQMGKKSYVSKHLLSGAADVRSRDMKPRQVEALRAAVKEEPGVVILDERSATEPHLHLSLQ